MNTTSERIRKTSGILSAGRTPYLIAVSVAFIVVSIWRPTFLFAGFFYCIIGLYAALAPLLSCSSCQRSISIADALTNKLLCRTCRVPNALAIFGGRVVIGITLAVATILIGRFYYWTTWNPMGSAHDDGWGWNPLPDAVDNLGEIRNNQGDVAIVRQVRAGLLISDEPAMYFVFVRAAGEPGDQLVLRYSGGGGGIKSPPTIVWLANRILDITVDYPFAVTVTSQRVSANGVSISYHIERAIYQLAFWERPYFQTSLFR